MRAYFAIINVCHAVQPVHGSLGLVNEVPDSSVTYGVDFVIAQILNRGSVAT